MAGIWSALAGLDLLRGALPGRMGPQKPWRYLGTNAEDSALDSSPGCTAYKLGDPNQVSLYVHTLLSSSVKWGTVLASW